MATTFNLSITVNVDAEAIKALDAFCKKYGYDPASGLTKQQFLKREVIEFIRLPWIEDKKLTNRVTADATTTSEVNSVTFS